MRKLLFAVFGLLLAASSSQAAEAIITGRAVVHRGDRLLPVSDLPVYAFSSEQGRLVRSRTDDEGRFQLAFPPQASVSIYEDDRGYRITAVNGRDGSRPQFDCSAGGPCGVAELVVQRLAVVEGTAVGAQGQPVEGVEFHLEHPDALPSEPGRSRRVPRARTDDRGRFRFHGIRPGDYELTVNALRMRPDEPVWEGDPLPVSIAEGADALGLQVPLRVVARTTLRGRISGLPPDAGEITLQLRSADGMRQFHSVYPAADGSFEIEGVPEGRYSVYWMEHRGEDETPRTRTHYLGMGEAGDAPPRALLEPREPARVHGRFSEVLWPEGGNVPRDSLVIRLPRLDPSALPHVYRIIPVEAPDFAFDFEIEQAGRYGFALNGPGPVLEEVSEGDTRSPFSGEIAVGEGETLELDLAVRFALGRLSVTVVPATGADGVRQESEDGRYVVALRDGDRVVTYTTDQHGRIAINNLRPGNWQIAAWRAIDRERIREASYWDGAGEAVRRFEHRETADVDLRLTAVAEGEPR